MNARLYDPAVGRFLSPDPLVQAPDNTQNYNRYSYCLNNPLRWTDETGLYFSANDQKRFENIRKWLTAEYNRLQNLYTNEKDPNDKQSWDDRAAEVLQSIHDINDMEMHKLYEFRFGTQQDRADHHISENYAITTSFVIWSYSIFTDETHGSLVHELRHGGQIARGEYNFNYNDTRDLEHNDYFADARFGIEHEVSAYKAQWGIEGKIKVDIMPVNLPLVTTKEISNLKQINADLICNIFDRSTGTYLYNF